MTFTLKIDSEFKRTTMHYQFWVRIHSSSFKSPVVLVSLDPYLEPCNKSV